jgi:hypothetical protein
LRVYMKPEFDYVSLTAEERFAGGASQQCQTYGSCPTSTTICSFTIDGTTYTATTWTSTDLYPLR